MTMYDNNSVLTEETFSTFNNWLRTLSNITPLAIDTVQVGFLKEALLGWRSCDAATKSEISGVPTWLFKLFLNFISNRYERSIEYGDPSMITYKQSDHIVSIARKSPAQILANTTGALAIEQTYAEYTFDTPDGYDGNYSHVRLLVPHEIISALYRRSYKGTVNANREAIDTNKKGCHPLLPAEPVFLYDEAAATLEASGGWGDSYLDTIYTCAGTTRENTLTSQKYGSYRDNALFFYRFFANKANITFDVLKNKDKITFTAKAVSFLDPFISVEDTELTTDLAKKIIPKVLVNIKYFKHGV